MSQYLPYDDISCLTRPEFNNLAINSISEDSPYVCLLEVDLEFTNNYTIYNSHKNRKDRLEGSLDRVFLAAELSSRRY